MKKKILIIFILLITFLSGCSNKDFTSEKYNLEVDNGLIYGTLTMSKGEGPFPVAIIIQGSGPTDRDGNNPISGDNNNLKMLAEHLATNGIASVRYDKRGIGESKDLVQKEEELVFEDYINDVKLWVDKVEKDDRFNKYFIIGHSEGALIGAAAAAETNVNGYVSIAGLGEPPFVTLARQLYSQSKDIYERSEAILNQLAKGNLVPNPPKDLDALFRESVQPYLISWFKYDPTDTIARVKAPTLIIQGDTDIQVTVDDAKYLYSARVSTSSDALQSKLVIVEGMNHIMKDAPLDREKNFKTYGEPKLPLNEEFKKEIIEFLKQL